MSVTFPSDVATPWTWIDASDASTITASGSTVTSVAGRGSTNITWSSAGTVSTGQDTIGSKNAIRLTGSGSLLRSGSTALPMTEGVSIFAVAKYVSSPAGVTMFGGGGASSPQFYYSLNDRYWGLNGGSNLVRSTAAVSLTTGSNFLVSGVLGSASSTNNFLGTNGTSDSLSTTTTNSNTYSARQWTIAGEAVTIAIGEYIVINADLNFKQRQRIEGYLAWKWGLESQLPAAHLYSTVNKAAAIVPRAIPVPMITDTTARPWLWYDAADPTAMLTNASGVLTGWANKGTGSLSGTGTVTGSPVVNVQNGHSTVFFPLGSKFTTPSMTPPAKQMAMFAVFKTFNLRDGYMSQIIGGTASGHLTSYISNYGTSAFSVSGFAGTNTVSVSVNPASTVLNTPVLATIINNASSAANNYLGFNGQSVTPTTSLTASVAATTASTYELFPQYNVNEYTTGTMAEIIVIRADITTTQRLQIEGYLAWKWGLQANLPAAHPFSVANKDATMALYTRPRLYASTFLSSVTTGPRGQVFDSAGNLWLATNTDGVYKISAAGAITKYAAGTGGSFIAKDAADNIYAVQTSSIIKITPAGVVTTHISGVSAPHGVAVDSSRNAIYVFESGTWKMSQYALDTGAYQSQFSTPTNQYLNDLVIDANGDIVTINVNSNRLERYNRTTGALTVIAGSGGASSVDGIGTDASFNGPRGLAMDAKGYFYVGDTEGHAIRRVSPSGAVLTIAGAVGSAANTNGIDVASRFNRPYGLSVHPTTGEIYISDFANNAIRKLGLGTLNQMSIYASVTNPYQPTTDGFGNLYIGSYGGNNVIKIAPNGTMTTFVGSGSPAFVDGVGTAAAFNSANGVAIDEYGNFYIGEHGADRIRKITPAGVVTIFIGSIPAPLGLTFGPDGHMYVACHYNQTIRKVVMDTRVVSIYAGAETQAGSTDNVDRLSARFNIPCHVAFYNGVMYVAEGTGAKIRKIENDIVTTFAGSGTSAEVDGTGTGASFTNIHGMAFDRAGNMFVTGWGATKVRKITPSAVVSTAASFGTTVYTSYCHIDSAQNLWVSNAVGNTFHHIAINAPPSGSVSITGTVAKGNTLTADVSTLADFDRLGALSYAWSASATANGVYTTIAGATAQTYTLTASEVGKFIKVSVSYTDGRGTAEATAAVSGTAVIDPNNVATGSITISGALNVYSTLTSTNNIADPDGLGPFTYQWSSSTTSNGTYTDIAGATASSYTLTATESGKFVKLTIRYTDQLGNLENVASTFNGPILANVAPTNIDASFATNAMTVKWTAAVPAPASYTVTAQPGNLTATVDGSSTSATITTPLNGVAYTATVTATYANGATVASATTTLVSPPAAIPVPMTTEVAPWLWYDAADPTTTRCNSSGVLTTLENKGTAGGGSTMTGSVTYGSTNLNNRPMIIVPTGSKIATSSAITPPAKSVAIFAVVNIDQVLDRTTRLVAGSQLGHISSYINFASNAEYIISGNNSVGNTIGTTLPLNTVRGKSTMLTIINSNVSTASNFMGVNGESRTLGDNQLTTNAATTASVYEIMSQYGATETGGSFAEVIIIRAELTATQRLQIEGYLAWKWGLQAKLPAAHPFSVANMSATMALYNRPRMYASTFLSVSTDAIITDSQSNLYVVQGAFNNRVRKYNPAGVLQWTVTTVGGVALNDPRHVARDNSDNIYVAENVNGGRRIIKITSAGVASVFLSNVSTSALTVDSTGAVYYYDSAANDIKKITSDGATVTIFKASRNAGGGMACDANDNIYTISSVVGNALISKITPDGTVTTFAGSGVAGAADGIGTDATFNIGGAMSRIQFDSRGYLYVSEYSGKKVRMISPAGVVITITGEAGVTSPTTAAANGMDINARYSGPVGVAPAPDGSVYIADSSNIRKLSTGALNQVGTYFGGQSKLANGNVADKFGNLYVVQHTGQNMLRISPTGAVTTFIGTGTAGDANGAGTSASIRFPTDVNMDELGNMYLTEGNRIRKITPAGLVTTFAGSSSATAGSTNGVGTAASFSSPAAVTFNTDGNIYLAETARIRKVSRAGVVTYYAGSGALSINNGNGDPLSATFAYPNDITHDSKGNLYIVDRDAAGTSVRMISAAGGISSFVSGLGALYTIAADNADNLYVLEQSGRLLKITPDKVVTVVAGAAAAASLLDGVGTAARFNGANYMTIDDYGNLWITEGAAPGAVRHVAINAPPVGSVTITGTPSVGQTLTANTSSLADADNLGAFTYAWSASSTANGVYTTISGATSSTFVPTATEANKYIKVTVSYTDGRGSLESVVAMAGAPVDNSNSPATGAITISGDLRATATLTSSNTIADANGLGTFTYEWSSSATENGTFAPIAGATASSYTLTTNEVSKFVKLTIRFVDQAGANEQVASAVQGPITANVPGAPTNITVAVAGDGQARVSFTPPATAAATGITGYLITTTPPSTSVTGRSSPITVSGLTVGTSYTFTVTPYNASGNGQSATSSSFTAIGVPSAPTNVQATLSSGQAVVSWTAPGPTGGSAITGYTVQSVPAGFTVSAASDATQATVTGLVNGISYQFEVYATNIAGNGPASTPTAPQKYTDITVAAAVSSAAVNNTSLTTFVTEQVSAGKTPTQIYIESRNVIKNDAALTATQKDNAKQQLAAATTQALSQSVISIPSSETDLFLESLETVVDRASIATAPVDVVVPTVSNGTATVSLTAIAPTSTPTDASQRTIIHMEVPKTASTIIVETQSGTETFNYDSTGQSISDNQKTYVAGDIVVIGGVSYLIVGINSVTLIPLVKYNTYVVGQNTATMVAQGIMFIMVQNAL